MYDRHCLRDLVVKDLILKKLSKTNRTPSLATNCRPQTHVRLTLPHEQNANVKLQHWQTLAEMQAGAELTNIAGLKGLVAKDLDFGIIVNSSKCQTPPLAEIPRKDT